SRSRSSSHYRHRPVPRHGPVGDQRDRQLAGDGGGRQVGGRGRDGGAARSGAGAATGRGRMSALRPAALRAGLLLAGPALFPPAPGAQEAPGVGVLSGTLKKIKSTGTITLGYRESSLPFSYLNKRQQPIGYSIDLCREVVEETATELDGMEIKIAF